VRKNQKAVTLNVVRLSVLFISAGAAVCALLIGSGCAEHGKTLVDAVQATTGERIALVEKLDVSSDNGLLGAEDMRGAKPLLEGHVSPFTLTARVRRAEVEAWRESSDWSFLARSIM